MKIGGYDYHFAFTIGAYLSLADMKIDTSGLMGRTRSVLQMAVVMANEYQDRACLENPKHKRKELTLQMLRSLDAYQLKQLSEEVDQAYAEGNNITVKTEKPKKK